MRSNTNGERGSVRFILMIPLRQQVGFAFRKHLLAATSPLRGASRRRGGSCRMLRVAARNARLARDKSQTGTRLLAGFDKSELRKVARAQRKALLHPGFAAAIARHAGALNVAKEMVVGGYHALPEEADPALL